MPRVSWFHGISIWMYRPDHPPPHFHVQYGESWAQVDIAEQRVITGWLPPRVLRMVQRWARPHEAELWMNWERAQALEELEQIDPLP